MIPNIPKDIRTPAYVLDIPGGHGKAPIGPDCLSGDADAGYVVEDYQGGRHVYPPSGSSA